MMSSKEKSFAATSCISSILTENKFTDGLSFLNTFSLLTKLSHVANKTEEQLNEAAVEQKWHIWHWKSDHRQVGNTPGKRLKWADLLVLKASFATHEEFWKVYSELNGFRMTRTHCDYFVFKAGIKPMWEDDHNRGGGRWIMSFPKQNHWKYSCYLDDTWLKLLLSLIGGNFDDYKDEICGATLNIRVGVDKITLWTANADKTLVNLKIGEILKSATGYKGQLSYDSHVSAANKSSTIESKKRQNRRERE